MHKDQAQGENVGKESLKAGYEVTDLNARVVSMFMVFLAVMTIGGLVIILIVMRGMEGARVRPDMSPLAQEGVMAPPAPNLQSDPRFDKDQAIKAATAQLGSYGWISEDPAMRRAHIPIEKAMEIVAAQQVPYKQKPVIATQGAASPAGADGAVTAPAATGITEERSADPAADTAAAPVHE
ncbi:MAG: hypothetical protein IT368_01325 [Candidatus Hydrogenedentes bacterium]|nr:hypothetical protein [Candidatus Hydrogenedentota bacterium]